MDEREEMGFETRAKEWRDGGSSGDMRWNTFTVRGGRSQVKSWKRFNRLK